MTELSLYRQKRQDGGIRTAIELNEETVFHRFEPGSDETDPSLLWYVDLRCKGDPLPKDPEAARRWLLDLAPVINDGLERFAEKLHAGFDLGFYPLEWSGFQGAPVGVELKCVCSSIRRLDALRLADVLRDFRLHWEEWAQSLPVEQPLPT